MTNPSPPIFERVLLVNHVVAHFCDFVFQPRRVSVLTFRTRQTAAERVHLCIFSITLSFEGKSLRKIVIKPLLKIKFVVILYIFDGDMSMNDGKNRIATNRIRRAGAKSLDLGKITV